MQRDQNVIAGIGKIGISRTLHDLLFRHGRGIQYFFQKIVGNGTSFGKVAALFFQKLLDMITEDLKNSVRILL